MTRNCTWPPRERGGFSGAAARGPDPADHPDPSDHSDPADPLPHWARDSWGTSARRFGGCHPSRQSGGLGQPMCPVLYWDRTNATSTREPPTALLALRKLQLLPLSPQSPEGDASVGTPRTLGSGCS